MVARCSVLLPLLIIWELHIATTSSRLSSYLKGSILDCRIEYISDYFNNEEDEFLCIPTMGSLESLAMIPLPNHLLTNTQKEAAKSGSLHVTVTEVALDLVGPVERLTFANNSTLIQKFVPTATRTAQIQPRAGSRTVSLAFIRISLDDTTPERSVQYLEESISSSASFQNVAKQLHDCSNQLLTIQSNGVIDVRLRGRLVDYESPATIMTAALDKLGYGGHINPSVGIPLADHVLFCIPPGTGNWKARAANLSWRSWYNNRMCGSMSATMHELGHNWGLGHSFENTVELGDMTGSMGFSDYLNDGPLRCYNAMNHVRLGWHTEQILNLNTVKRGGQTIDLVAFALVSSYPDSVVIINVGDLFFIQYNLAVGINAGTREKINEVTITVLEQERDTNSIAGLGASSSFTSPNFQGRDLVVRTCGTVGSHAMRLSIGLGEASCSAPGAPGATSSPPPTRNPTRSPTRQPTRSPTPQPTRVPTPQPTRNPTKSPTRASTSLPTSNPKSPTRRPNQPPPTRIPTPNPNPSTPAPSLDTNELGECVPTVVFGIVTLCKY